MIRPAMRHRERVKTANEIAARRAVWPDADHAVHAAYLLGGVTKEWKTSRGVIVERWLMGDDDVTQTMIRLDRACMLTEATSPHLDDEMKHIVARKVLAALSVRTHRRKK